MDTPLSKSMTGTCQKVLVVDDDATILRLVKDQLDRAGFDVLTAPNGRVALAVLEKHGLPHLAIVDIHMPEMDGLEFCTAVQQFSDLPVIMLTAVDEEEIVIHCIERFAEDFISKPFSPRELIARVRRVLRRVGDFTYAFRAKTRVDDRLAVDFVNQCVWVEDKRVSLTPIETKLLYLLMRNAGRTVTNDFLLCRLWPMEEVFEDTLRVHVHRLRHKIEPVPSKPYYIVTERGTGYSFLSFG